MHDCSFVNQYYVIMPSAANGNQLSTLYITLYLHALLDDLFEVVEGFLVRGAQDGAEEEVAPNVHQHDLLRTLENLQRGAVEGVAIFESNMTQIV